MYILDCNRREFDSAVQHNRNPTVTTVPRVPESMTKPTKKEASAST